MLVQLLLRTPSAAREVWLSLAPPLEVAPRGPPDAAAPLQLFLLAAAAGPGTSKRRNANQDARHVAEIRNVSPDLGSETADGPRLSALA